MCGRYVLTQKTASIASHFQLDLGLPPQQQSELTARYNIAPTQPVLAVRAGRDGQRQAVGLQWGLIPSWAKDPAIGSRLINARSETLQEKPAFRGAYRYRRCLIPADGFYEWMREGKRSQPYFIRLQDGGLFSFAGLWEEWERADGYLATCTLLTTSANELVRPLHERMPVILHPEYYDTWLDPDLKDPRQVDARLGPLLAPYPAAAMERYPVSTLVNRVGSEGPELIEPIQAAPRADPGQLSLI